MRAELPSAAQVFRAIPCFLGRLLVAARAMTRLYNDEMRAVSLEITQFSILQLLQQLGPMTQNQLGERLAASKTTVSRNVGLLEKHGWVSVEVGEDRRAKVLSLSNRGRLLLEKAEPLWERAQARFRAEISGAQLRALQDLLPTVAEAALRA